MNDKRPTVLITGAGQRIGRAIALDLAGKGWDIALHCRTSIEGAETTAAEATKLGARAVVVSADLGDVAACHALVDKSADQLGDITGLINCASVFEPDELANFSEASWAAHLDVNLKAPLVLAQAFAKSKRDHQKRAIVNFIDQRVLKPTPQFFSYTVSKLALWQATKTLAQSLAPEVRVNAIAPGPTLQNARQSETDFQAQIDATLLKTGSPVREICRGVHYLLEAEAVTGQTLFIDGGQHLIWQTPDIVGVNE